MVNETLFIGDTRVWTVPKLQLSDIESVTLSLLGPSSQDIECEKTDKGFEACLTHEISKQLAAGQYTLVAFYYWDEKKSRYSLPLGKLKMVSLPESGGSYDGRTMAERALEDCQNALAKFNSSGGRVQSYSIAGRSMTFTSITELMKLLEYWKSQVRLERQNGIERRIRYVRF